MTTWAWVRQPHDKHPLDQPFAWALIQPRRRRHRRCCTPSTRGARAPSPPACGCVPRWADERVGEINDIACFDPEEADDRTDRSPRCPRSASASCVTSSRSAASARRPGSTTTFTAGRATTRFLRGIIDQKLLGQQACPVAARSTCPPAAPDPSPRRAHRGEVELAHVGTVTSFCVVNVAFYGSVMEIPYVSALILLDGADLRSCTSSRRCRPTRSTSACGSRRSGSTTPTSPRRSSSVQATSTTRLDPQPGTADRVDEAAPRLIRAEGGES